MFIDGDGDGVIEGADKESWKEFNRLCLQVFDKGGKRNVILTIESFSLPYFSLVVVFITSKR